MEKTFGGMSVPWALATCSRISTVTTKRVIGVFPTGTKERRLQRHS